MAKFIRVHTRYGKRYVNVDHIIFVGEGSNSHSGRILCDLSNLDFLDTTETYEQIVELINS